MYLQYEKVIEFQKKIGAELPPEPCPVPRNVRHKMVTRLYEEVNEFLNAIDIYEQAHEITDILYVVLGMFAQIGVSPSELFDAVHYSNMTRDEDAKKGAGYVDPRPKIEQIVKSPV